MAKRSKRPNILFITCDQWRSECLGAAGHPVVKTPNVDALAKEGVLFKRHFAGAAPCSPARACLYTGLYQMNNRVCRNGTPLDARHDTVALAARRAGYDPTLFGYSDTSPDPRAFPPRDPVLTSYEGVLPGLTARQLLPEHQKPWLSWLSARGLDVSAGYPDIHQPKGGARKTPDSRPPLYTRDQSPAAFLAGEFARWFGEQGSENPWFAHVSFLSPHPPFIAPEPFNAMYAPGDGPDYRRAVSHEAEDAIHPWVAYDGPRQKLEKFLPGMKGRVRKLDPKGFDQIRATYFGMISDIDANLGRMFAAIRKGGAWDDTVVVLTSDHAEMMGDHFMLGKGGFFDGSYHIPLVIRDPRRKAARGEKIDAFTEAVDIMPTVLDLIGERKPAHLDGRSLLPFLEGGQPKDWRDAAFWEFDFRSVPNAKAEKHFGLNPQQCNLAVLRTEKVKYVHFGGLPPVLFDLENDPAETRNLADDPAWSAVRLEFAERLLAKRAAHLDQRLALMELTEGGVVHWRP